MTPPAKSSHHRMGILGGGAWGTALSHILAEAGNQVTLWAYESEVVQKINSDHENVSFLPGFRLSSNLRATHDLAEACSQQAIILFVVPAQHTRVILEQTRRHLTPTTPLV